MDAAVFNDGQSVEAWEKRHARERLKKYNGNGGGTPLAMAVRLPSWATPTVGDSRGGATGTCPAARAGSESASRTKCSGDSRTNCFGSVGTTILAHCQSERLAIRQSGGGNDLEELQAPLRVGGDDQRGAEADGEIESPLGVRSSGLPAGLVRWPSRPGEVQEEWEAPRVAAGVPDRAAKLKALGNAVVPQVAYVVGCMVREIQALAAGKP